MQLLNEEIFALARDSRGVTQEELSKALGVTPGLVSKWGHGILTPSLEQVSQMAEFLGYPTTLFYRPERVRHTDSICFHHKKRKSMPVKPLIQTEGAMHLAQLQIKRLLTDLAIEPSLPFMTLDPDELGSAAEVGRTLRHYWRVPIGPITNLVKLVETAGAVVLIKDFGTRKLDGMSCWGKDTPPLFFLNSEMSTDRMRWTLAHELGHLTMHASPPEGDPEEQAEDFAREFLLPEKETSPDLRLLTFQRLPALKRKWRVPMKEILTAASRRGLLPPNKVKSLAVQYSRAGWNAGEPYEIAPEEPEVVRMAVQVHLDQHEYTPEQVARVVDLLVEEFREQYQIPGEGRPRLRML